MSFLSRLLSFAACLLIVSWLWAENSVAQAESSSPHLELPKASELVSHPAFAPLVDDSLAWTALSVHEMEHNSAKPIVLLSPLRNNLPSLNFSIRQVMLHPRNQAYAKECAFTLASPAWWSVFDQRLVFTNQMDLARAQREFFLTSSVPLQVITSQPEVDVIAYQQPQLGFQAAEFQQFLNDVLGRFQIDSQHIGQSNRYARYGRFQMLQSTVPADQPFVDLSNLYNNSATLLTRAAEVDLKAPSDFLQTVFITTQAKEFKLAGSVGQTQVEKLNQKAREVFERSWQAWEEGQFRLFVGQEFSQQEKIVSYSLGENCRVLLLEKAIPGAQNQQQRARKLLAEVEELFVNSEGLVSDQVTQLASGSLVASGWSQLHNRALLCQARIAWRGKEVDLSWLEQVADLARKAENPEFPPALSPPFPGDPDSLLGIVLVGQACLMAAEVQPEQRATWLERSKALFELMEERYGAGERGYFMLPQGHPWEVPPEAFFVSTPDGKNSLLTQHGLWLRKMEAEGIEAAGKRADELLGYYTRWRLIRAAKLADLYFTRGIPLQKAT